MLSTCRGGLAALLLLLLCSSLVVCSFGAEVMPEEVIEGKPKEVIIQDDSVGGKPSIALRSASTNQTAIGPRKLRTKKAKNSKASLKKKAADDSCVHDEFFTFMSDLEQSLEDATLPTDRLGDLANYLLAEDASPLEWDR